ncbi:MAG TPA: hypothetical protein PLK92_02745 [Candidatus Paceibacterota bacterium]|jgi:hypothetical protein|nr:hypothetical protein [Candidatus Paceibacterota bacterium]HPB60720.1 hypothetical protein [Candidatus Paceibacterota bacterium]HPI24756.1 hypothetical protein [Candidatus Paceibacterota bacterium]HPN89484.1 hypothetical protein [Candidatus Paceibacterota bacterium]HPV33271.1 hypothetical protein [Candidatus Paceibacterota bacterium]
MDSKIVTTIIVLIIIVVLGIIIYNYYVAEPNDIDVVPDTTTSGDVFDDFDNEDIFGTTSATTSETDLLE